MQQLGPEAEFWDASQCVLDRNADNQWVLSPLGGTTNETLLNGKAVTGPVVLRHGDSIAVGRQAKGIVKMPLSVRGT
jgi:pSer/pThr/pTyr-binding forkhead associated (FHA) protein